MKNDLAIFENYKIRRIYDDNTETWFFSVVDIIKVLIQQPDFQVARKYWNKLKERLKKEGSESVTNCHLLKLEAADGKKYPTDVANTETLLRIIQSIPTINEHLKNIFSSEELNENSVIRNFLITASDGKKYNTNFYNLDASGLI